MGSRLLPRGKIFAMLEEFGAAVVQKIGGAHRAWVVEVKRLNRVRKSNAREFVKYFTSGPATGSF
jgi:hypothetical protein